MVFAGGIYTLGPNTARSRRRSACPVLANLPEFGLTPLLSVEDSARRA
jgi:hypothetical protein